MIKMLYLGGRENEFRKDKDGKLESILWLTVSSILYFCLYFLTSENGTAALASEGEFNGYMFCITLTALNDVLFFRVFNEERTKVNEMLMGVIPVGYFILVLSNELDMSLKRCFAGLIGLCIIVACIKGFIRSFASRKEKDVRIKLIFKSCLGRAYELGALLYVVELFYVFLNIAEKTVK